MEQSLALPQRPLLCQKNPCYTTWTMDVLATLPERQRAALVLRFYADLPGNEIATILGCREGTVKSLIHRGLARLRQEVGE